MSAIPDHSNLHDAAATATAAVSTTATTAASGTATIAIGDAFTAIAAFLATAQSTQDYRSNVDVAAQKFNELVAAVNAIVA